MERHTRQREVVEATLKRAERPLSARELVAAAGRTVAGIGIATVYRHLKVMVSEGRIAAVTLPGEPARYESAGKTHHHHFVCDACERVFDVTGCTSDVRRLTPRGFKVDRHEVVLYGRCAECTESDDPSR